MAGRVFIVAGLWMVLNAYAGWQLLSPAAVSPPWRGAGWVVMTLLALAPFGAFFASRLASVPARPVLEWAGFGAMGLSSLLIVFVVVGAVLDLRSWLGAGRFSAGAVTGALLVLVFGAWRARRPGVVRVAVPIARLPAELEGFRIVQLSDLHVSGTLGRAFVERVVATTNELRPDVIALTGDVGDGLPAALRRQLAPLAQLTAAGGRFFVTGNHEYYWDGPGWVCELERLGFTPLVNTHRVIERGAATLVLAGVTDLSAGGSVPAHRSDPDAALAGAPAADVRVLLAHHPKSAFAALAAGFDLQLSGHTHGGQYFPFNLLVRLFQPFVSGLHRLGRMWLYVSRGTGYWGPPLRLGAPSEVTVIELTRAPEAAA
jgi:predicted MPP superfamily phosphohydrolase